MKLGAKISILGAVSLALILGLMMSFVIWSFSKSEKAAIDNYLQGNLYLARDQIHVRNNNILSLAESISKNRALARSLDRDESLGLAQVLNEYVQVYPYLNYILVTENDGSIFASSTISHQGVKLAGEDLLLEDSRTNPLYSKQHLKQQNSKIDEDSKLFSGPVKDDIYLPILGLEQKKAQWVRSLIFKKGQIIGEVILSLDWEALYQNTLLLLTKELNATGTPLLGATIKANPNKTLVSATLKGTDISKNNVTADNRINVHRSLNINKEDLSIWLIYDKERLYLPVKEAQINLTLVAVITTILLAAVLYLLIRSVLLKKITALEEGVALLGDGKLDTQLPSLGNDELGALGEGINNMSKQLSSSLISVDRLNEEAELRKIAMLELRDHKLAVDQHAIVAITDVRGTITYANDNFCKVSGYTRDELIGQNHRIVKSGLHDEEFFREMYLTISKGNVWRGEMCNRAKSGDLYWVDTTLVPFLGLDGKPKSYIAIRTDITQIRAAEKAKNEFLANMSHEIRTPMNGVIGMLHLLESTDSVEEQKEQIKIAKSSADSLLTVINDILDFSKIEAGKLEIEAFDFPLISLLSDLAKLHALPAESKGVELILQAPDNGEITLTGDGGRLRQILNNIVGNAVKFTQEGEIIIKIDLAEIEGAEPKTLLKCSVSDTGIGIPTEKIEGLFDAFTQADASTTRHYGGTGLGLSITSQLCKLMGGEIEVQSEFGKGTCFNFEIPFGICPDDHYINDNLDLAKLNVLVVDDNQTNLTVLEAMLHQWNANAVLASSANEAINIVQEKPAELDFGLIISDCQMPKTDGIELCKHLRKESTLSNTPIIMMSSIEKGVINEDDIELFDAWFTKPFVPSALKKVIIDLIPQASDQNVGEAELINPPTPENNARSKTSLHQVLLVEDNAVNQIVAKTMLENLDCEVDVAENGEEAIEMIKSKPKGYHIIFMDCQMPVLDGYQATSQIRSGAAGNEHQKTPIVAMTANAMKGDREKCLNAGMDDYLTKPIDLASINEKLEQWLIK